jgi:capsular exopolysaccharide synthesis family protein
VLVGTVLLSLGFGAAISILKTPTYEASTDLQFIDESQQLSLLGIPPPAVETVKKVAADAKVITSRRVVRRVARALELSPNAVVGSVRTSIDPDTNLVTLTTSAESGKLAARLANQLARQARAVATASERARLERAARRARRSIAGDTPAAVRILAAERASTLASLASVVTPVEIVTPATVPGSPSSPKPLRDTFLALCLGLVFGTLLAFVRDSLDRRLTDVHDIQHHFPVPTIGYVDDEVMGMVGSANGAVPGSDAGMEAFRIIRSNVDLMARDQPVRTVAVTSPLAEEGKSTVAAGLASASALAGKRVLLIECDLRKPILAQRFNLRSEPGLTDWIGGAARPGDVVQATPIYRNGSQADVAAKQAPIGSGTFVTIVAGSATGQPAEQLASEHFRSMISQVQKVYDLVVLDCAPLLPVGDALEVLPYVDGILMCIRLDKTTRDQAGAARAALDHLPPRPTGLVVTGVRPGRHGYYYGYYSAEVMRPPILAPPAQ